MKLSRLHASREPDGERQEDDDETDKKAILPKVELKVEDGETEGSNLLVTSTVSVPEVSLVPSPEVSKVS